jgi:signal transduction histidine kinase
VLGTVVRPAPAIGSSISLSTADGMVHLLITGGAVDRGTPAVALADVRQRAERLGGSCAVEQSNGSVVVSWQIPIPTP